MLCSACTNRAEIMKYSVSQKQKIFNNVSDLCFVQIITHMERYEYEIWVFKFTYKKLQ